MNKGQLLELLHNPGLLNQETEPALRELLQEFPYFAAAQQLLARNYQLTGNYRFDKQLHLAAIHVPSRAALYEMLNEGLARQEEGGAPAVFVANTELPISDEPIKTQESISAITTVELMSEREEKEPATPLSLAEPEPDEQSQASEILLEALPGEGATEIERIPESPEMPDRAVEEMPDTDKESGEAPAEAPVITEPEPEEEEEESNPLQEPEWEPQPEAEPAFTAAVSEVQETEHTVSAPVAAIQEEPTDFLTWLKWSAQLKQSTQEATITQDIQAKEEPSPVITNSDKPEDVPVVEVKLPEQISEPIPSKEDTLQAMIIEKFLKEKPSISRPTATRFFKAEVAARESIMEDENLVSETLARLHARQGNLEKAIRIYEKLCLKYPDKKQTFASQIIALREELNR